MYVKKLKGSTSIDSTHMEWFVCEMKQILENLRVLSFFQVIICLAKNNLKKIYKKIFLLVYLSFYQVWFSIVQFWLVLKYLFEVALNSVINFQDRGPWQNTVFQNILLLFHSFCISTILIFSSGTKNAAILK